MATLLATSRPTAGVTRGEGTRREIAGRSGARRVQAVLGAIYSVDLPGNNLFSLNSYSAYSEGILMPKRWQSNLTS